MNPKSTERQHIYNKSEKTTKYRLQTFILKHIKKMTFLLQKLYFLIIKHNNIQNIVSKSATITASF